MIQISEGVHHCHMQNVVHKDLKPLNILISQGGQLKICDFGIARVIDNTKPINNTGTCTTTYAAPEMLQGKEYRYKVDIWSLGCILYELCALQKPFVPQFMPNSTYNQNILMKLFS